MKTAFNKLTLDQRDALAELLGNEGWKPLLAVIDGLAREEEEKVLSLHVNDGPDKIIHQKLKAEGARALAINVRRMPEFIRALNKEG